LKNPFSLSTLRRQTSGRAYVPEVDGLRFIAILSVVLFHISVQVQDQPGGKAIFALLDPVVHNGYRGVELFFVISGFILGLPFARHRLTGAPIMRLRTYFYRRLTRLEPPYIAIILIRAALIVFVLHQSFRLVLPHLLATLGYMHSLVYGYFSSINPPVWSLEVEIQFYCLAPFLAWLLFSFRRSDLLRRAGFVALILAAGVCQQLLISPENAQQGRFAYSILFSFQYFLAGFLLCDLYVIGWEKIPHHWLWDLVCLPLWVWVFWWNSPWFHVWLPLACVVLYVGAFKGPVHRAFFRNPIIATIGGMCYSIYLTHNLVLTKANLLFRPITAHGPPSLALVWVISGLITLLVFAAGLMYYVLLERPCMERDWPQKLAVRLRLRPPEPAPAE
jgi:peptidoglycan/LPS O-acetylase OafA/YrhL